MFREMAEKVISNKFRGTKVKHVYEARDVRAATHFLQECTKPVENCPSPREGPISTKGILLETFNALVAAVNSPLPFAQGIGTATRRHFW